jgi:hypothetical protein
MHQTHEFTSGEDEGTLVRMLGHLAILTPVEGLAARSRLNWRRVLAPKVK